MKHFFLILFTFFFAHSLVSQSINTRFGKNRVQYHDDFDDWWMYESQNFITYWYGKGRKVAETVVQLAEYDNDEIQSLLEHRINDKIEIIVYTDLTDLKQSNIGSEETFLTSTGQTKIVGRKIFVYFDGNHQQLREQIRQGVASVYLASMLEGANLQEIVQNAVMSNLPDWYKDGVVSYIGSEWDENIDNEFRNLFFQKKGRYKNFNKFSRDYPRIAGHSFWYFMGVTYGKTTIANLLYLTRINRSLPSGVVYVLGTTFDALIDEWEAFYEQRYEEDLQVFTPLPSEGLIKLKNKKEQIISQIKLSPDGKSILYVVNDIGKSKVYIYDVERDKTEFVCKVGFRNSIQQNELNYPLIAWRADGLEISVMYEKRDVIKLLRYNLAEGVQIIDDLSPEYHRVYSMEYLNEEELVLSANTDGYSDLYVYDWKRRNSDRLTNDFFDDLDAHYIQSEELDGILFSSNRQDELLIKQKLDTVMPIDDFDLFFLALNETPYTLHRLNQSKNINERKAVAYNNEYISYISDQNGLFNQAMAKVEKYITHNDRVLTLKDGSEIRLHEDSTLQKLDESLIVKSELIPVSALRLESLGITRYQDNLLGHHSGHSNQENIEIYLDEKGQYNLYKRPIDLTQFGSPVYTTAKKQYLEKIRPENPEGVIQQEAYRKELNQNYEDNSKYTFQTEFPDFETEESYENTSENNVVDIARPSSFKEQNSSQKEVHRFVSARAIAYRLKFKIDYFNTNMDNSLLFEGLDTYAATKQNYNYPPPGILVKANIKDLFEDHVIEGGARFPTTFNGSEYFLFYDDKKRRIDKRYSVYRKSLKQVEEVGIFSDTKSKTTTVIGQVELKYPLNIYSSLRATGTFRTDKFLFLSTDLATLEEPDLDEQRLGLKAEFVFDNSLDIDFNIKNGTRFKVYAEAVKKFNISLANNWKFDFDQGFMTVIGFDARHYVKLAKHSVFAARLAASTTFGSERIIYYIGDIEQTLFPKFDESVPFPSEDNFAYSTVAGNLRGFNYNARNGSTFAVFNSELRVPIFKYLFDRRIRSSFIRNFQLVAFADVGSAWYGASPNSDENPINTIEFENPPTVKVRVKYFRDPFIYGYGVGMRTLLFGYFIKADYAWGVDTRTVLKPKLHLSLGVDF